MTGLHLLYYFIFLAQNRKHGDPKINVGKTHGSQALAALYSSGCCQYNVFSYVLLSIFVVAKDFHKHLFK